MAAVILNAPTVNTTQIIDVLKRDIPKAWSVPIYDEFPSSDEKVRYGIYVSDVHTNSRTPHQLAIQYCGAIYHAFDVFDVTYISYQDDPYNLDVNAIIANLVIALKDDGQQLMEGYFERNFNQVRTYGPTQAEKHVWTFELTRLEFNT
jgi:hypothetical protein